MFNLGTRRALIGTALLVVVLTGCNRSPSAGASTNPVPSLSPYTPTTQQPQTLQLPVCLTDQAAPAASGPLVTDCPPPTPTPPPPRPSDSYSGLVPPGDPQCPGVCGSP